MGQTYAGGGIGLIKAVSESVYVGDVTWTLRVRARPGRHADSQSPRYTYTNTGTAINQPIAGRDTTEFKFSVDSYGLQHALTGHSQKCGSKDVTPCWKLIIWPCPRGLLRRLLRRQAMR